MSKQISYDVLLKAVEQGLDILGTTSKQAFLFHLENIFKITPVNIISDIEGFQAAMKRFFGQAYYPIESLIRYYLSSFTGQELSEQMDLCESIGFLQSKIE
jgi:hypothetical protein